MPRAIVEGRSLLAGFLIPISSQAYLAGLACELPGGLQAQPEQPACMLQASQAKIRRRCGLLRASILERAWQVSCQLRPPPLGCQTQIRMQETL